MGRSVAEQPKTRPVCPECDSISAGLHATCAVTVKLIEAVMRIRNALAIAPLLAVPALLAQACLSGTCEDASKECPSGPFHAANPNAKTGGNGAVGGGAGQSGLTTGGAAANPGGMSSGVGGAGAPARVCDATKLPSEEPCLIDEMYGVFVSPLGNDGTGDGSRKKPFASIGKGIMSVRADHRRVYVCAPANALTTPVEIGIEDKGLQLFGDFRCADGWVSGVDISTKITSNAAGALLISQSENIRIEGFEFAAADAVDSGGSSYGAFVKGSTNVVFSHVKITAGKGKAGSDGVTWPEAAAKGTDGNAGKNACSGDNAGAIPVQNQCAIGTSLGGKGGDGGALTGSGGNAAPGSPNAPPLGNGGVGQTGGSLQCAPGVGLGYPGQDGVDAGPANGASAMGVLSTSGYQPQDGSTGLSGAIGGGGGGGGGAKAPATCGNGVLVAGASGGSGGAGGCGGSAGGGGKGGGGSFALVSIGSTITLDTVTLATSDGGTGGKGGKGQIGGVGGQPGAAAAGVSSLASCAGGMGGKGGNGGDGGGGAGGPSIGIAYTGTAPTELAQTVAITVAASALGGPDASGATTGSGVGVIGISEARHMF